MALNEKQILQKVNSRFVVSNVKVQCSRELVFMFLKHAHARGNSPCLLSLPNGNTDIENGIYLAMQELKFTIIIRSQK